MGNTQLKIPALQRVGSRACVSCGSPADAFCARCGVTPYCSARCQRRDWQGRHSAVCHNLARSNAPLDVDEVAAIETNIPAPAPLRRPRSPPPAAREPPALKDDDATSDKGAKKYTPAGHNIAPSGPRNTHGGGGRNFNNNQFDKPNRQFDKSDRQFDKSDRQFDKSDRQFDKSDRPDRQFDKPNRQSDKPDRQFEKSDRQFEKSDRQFEKSDRFNKPDRQGLDGGRPSFRRPHAANDDDEKRNTGQRYRDRYHQKHQSGGNLKRQLQNRVKFADENPKDEDWDCQSYGDRQPNQKLGNFVEWRQFQEEQLADQRYSDEEEWDGQSYGDRQPNQKLGNFVEWRQFQEGQSTDQRYSDEEEWDGQSYGDRQPNQKLGNFVEWRQFQEGQSTDQRYSDEEEWDVIKPQAKEEPKSVPVKPAVKETPVVRANRTEAAPRPSNQNPAPRPSNQNAAPPANQKEVKSPAANVKPLASAVDTTPTRKLIPKNCLIETLEKGEEVLLSVDNLASECHTKSSGFVCLTLHEKTQDGYSALCEEYGAACEADTTPYKPTPGETFSYFDSEDGGWYRARCLSASHCALLDASKVVQLSGARTVRLPAQYESTPEYTSLLQATVQLGDALKAVLVEKTANGWKVELSNVDGSPVGQGELSRWLPAVQYPAPAPAPAVAGPAIPEVDRPDVTNNSLVMIVDVTDSSNVFVRPQDIESQRAFDAVLHDTALYGMSATPLPTPPTAGTVVVSKFSDGLHYRALLKRTNTKQNKYLLEYLEYGNSQINTLENLYPCPDNLHPKNTGVMTSRVSLLMTSQHALTPPAEQYLDTLKDNSVELTLTIPSGEKTAPSGSEVILTVASNKENVNNKVSQLCTPEWVKLEERGGDVLETERIMYNDVEFIDLPSGHCELTVLDHGDLRDGSLSVCLRSDAPRLLRELASLTERMGKYCESKLGREPYLPKAEELCIARMPSSPHWYRAVLASQDEPGGALAEVCYIDRGTMARIPVTDLRKMLPEFQRALPAIASTTEIRGFPRPATREQIQRAVDFLKIDSEGHGTLRIAKAHKDAAGLYTVDAPELIAAITSQ